MANRISHVVLAVLTALPAVASAPAAAQAPKVPIDLSEPLDAPTAAWLDAVSAHEPGRADIHVKTLAGWPWQRLGQVLRAVRERGTEALMLRSAMLLSDIAFQVPVEDRRMPDRPSRGFAIVSEDGEHRGTTSLDPHLDEARKLLDGVASDAEAPDYLVMQAHAVAWYRAVSAVLARRMNLADLQPHIDRSIGRFPKEAGILFDAGCYEETYAAPVMQAALTRRRTLDTEKPSAARPLELLRSYAQSAGRLLAGAEEYFRAAIREDPTFTEARVRLGRVLLRRDRPSDAARELAQAVKMPGDETVRYYAWLFSGEALERTGKGDEAMQAYRAAEALFPGAQSPQLAIGRLATERGDRAAASAALERVLSADPYSDAHFDPWWMYDRARGRDAEPIYQALAARINGVPLEDGKTWKARQ